MGATIRAGCWQETEEAVQLHRGGSWASEGGGGRRTLCHDIKIISTLTVSPASPKMRRRPSIVSATSPQRPEDLYIQMGLPQPPSVSSQVPTALSSNSSVKLMVSWAVNCNRFIRCVVFHSLQTGLTLIVSHFHLHQIASRNRKI